MNEDAKLNFIIGTIILIIISAILSLIRFDYNKTNDLHKEILTNIENGTLKETPGYRVYSIRGNIYIVDVTNHIYKLST